MESSNHLISGSAGSRAPLKYGRLEDNDEAFHVVDHDPLYQGLHGLGATVHEEPESAGGAISISESLVFAVE